MAAEPDGRAFDGEHDGAGALGRDVDNDPLVEAPHHIDFSVSIEGGIKALHKGIALGKRHGDCETFQKLPTTPLVRQR